MKKWIKSGFILAVAFIVQSCNVMYNPNMQNVPLLKEKDEARFTIGMFDFQGAYAVQENLGVMVNGNYGRYNTTSSSLGSDNTTQGLIEAGVGYIKPFSENTIFELYGGYGAGENSIKSTTSDYVNGGVTRKTSFSASTSRFFIQPSIGFSVDFLDVALSTRICLLNYSNIYSSGYTDADLIAMRLANIDKQTYAFIEPAFTVRAGYKYIKFHGQLLFSYKYNLEPLDYIPLSLNFGIHIDLAKRNKITFDQYKPVQ